MAGGQDECMCEAAVSPRQPQAQTSTLHKGRRLPGAPPPPWACAAPLAGDKEAAPSRAARGRR